MLKVKVMTNIVCQFGSLTDRAKINGDHVVQKWMRAGRVFRKNCVFSAM